MHKIFHETKKPEADSALIRGQAPRASYYRDNCSEAFAFVLSHYKEMLPQHLLYQLQAYLDCSEEAQRLFARLLQQKDQILV